MKNWQERLKAMLGVDLRTLALFRFVLGITVMADALARLADVRTFYTDGGVMPRDLAATLAGPQRVSLLFANGEAWFAALALIVEALAALAFAFGCRARAANAVAFVLAGSVLTRNPLVLVDGDTLLVCLLFWSLFLPLNARWSVDAALAENPPPEGDRHLSAGSVGLSVQLLCVLAVSALAPGAQDTWLAIACAVPLILPAGWLWEWAARRADHGRHLKIYYDGDCTFCERTCRLLRTLLALPRTEILPAQGSVRAQTLMQAQDSWVVIDGHDVAHTRWSAFVALLQQSLLFAWLAPLFALGIWERPGVAAYDAIARRRRALGALTAPWLRRREVRYEPGRVAQILAGLAVAAVLAGNAAQAGGLRSSIDAVLRPLRIDQHWALLSSSPAGEGGYVIPGTFEDGREIDLVSGTTVDWHAPAREPNRRWRAYHARLLETGADANREAYARWLCREWNSAAPAGHRLERLQVTYVTGQGSDTEQRVLLRHDCR